jgi:hypothetical protein
MTMGTKRKVKKVDTKKLMRLLESNDDNKHPFDGNLKENSKQKEKGRISMPDEPNLSKHNSQNKKIDTLNLLKMPFSLNDIDQDEIASPHIRNVSDQNEYSQSASLEIQMEQVDDDLYEVDERNLH